MASPKYMAHGGRGYDSKERFYNAGEGLKVKHTAGPWWVRGAVVIGDGYELADCGNSFKPMPEKLANALLIASAPDLLKMLRGAVERLVECDSDCASWDSDEACNCFLGEAKQVIAKAEGRTA